MLKAFLFHSYTQLLDYSLENQAPVYVEFVPHRRLFRVDVPWYESLITYSTAQYADLILRLP